MAIVTTHGDMGAIYAEARALDTEMKKIAGRFLDKTHSHDREHRVGS
jgi:hypothetical protein